MRKIFISLTLFFILQCGVLAEDSAMSRVMNSWQGVHVDTVIKSWGYPNDEKNIAGHKLLYWYNDQNPKYIQTSSYTGTVQQYYCTRIFEVDEYNIVTSWQYEGNACPNFYFTCQDWVNPNNDPWKQESMQRKLLKQQKRNRKLKKNNNK